MVQHGNRGTHNEIALGQGSERSICGGRQMARTRILAWGKVVRPGRAEEWDVPAALEFRESAVGLEAWAAAEEWVVDGTAVEDSQLSS